MNRGIMLLIIVIALGIGFLVGQSFPKHRYIIASSQGDLVLVDTTTGRACSSLASMEGYNGKLPPCPK